MKADYTQATVSECEVPRNEISALSHSGPALRQAMEMTEYGKHGKPYSRLSTLPTLFGNPFRISTLPRLDGGLGV
jgi:hypothetical protein